MRFSSKYVNLKMVVGINKGRSIIVEFYNGEYVTENKSIIDLINASKLVADGVVVNLDAQNEKMKKISEAANGTEDAVEPVVEPVEPTEDVVEPEVDKTIKLGGGRAGHRGK